MAEYAKKTLELCRAELQRALVKARQEYRPASKARTRR